jgi:hypothetical protein
LGDTFAGGTTSGSTTNGPRQIENFEDILTGNLGYGGGPYTPNMAPSGTTPDCQYGRGGAGYGSGTYATQAGVFMVRWPA